MHNPSGGEGPVGEEQEHRKTTEKPGRAITWGVGGGLAEVGVHDFVYQNS